MRQLRILFLVSLLMVNGCSSSKLDTYKDMQPAMDLQEYFNGSIKAWGIVQDWRGRVVSRFDVEMTGSWEGDIGTLKEHFDYYDEDKQQERVWTISKVSNDRYVGTASDILDKASGTISGNAMRWSYIMDLPVGDTTYRITFDDWMWRMNDGVLINRSYLKKFGFTVAELTLFMQKQHVAK